MKKFSLSMIFVFIIALLSGCIVTDNQDKYERKQFQTTEDIYEIMVNDISTNYTLKVSDSKEMIVDYSDSPTDSWYTIEVSDDILKINKTRGTVGVEDSSVIITMPKKEYQNISIETTNGDIIFDNVSSQQYKCFTENGDIKGTLEANEADYLIVVKTKNGKSNIKDNVIESSKTIEFSTKNGDVKIVFNK